MQKITLLEISKIIAAEYVLFPNVKVTPELFKVWHSHFSQCNAQEFYTALHLSVNQNETGFPPAPGQVWKIIREMRATPESLETSDQAWISAMSGDTKISARAKAATEIMGDWKHRGLWKTEYLHFKKKDFERIYNDLKEQDEILITQHIARKSIGYARQAFPDAIKQIAEGLECR